MGRNERVYFFRYIAAASTLVMLIVLSQYYRYNMFGMSLLLGWDSARARRGDIGSP